MLPDGDGVGRKPIAFISHHSSQEATARHLKTVLERNGVVGWMAPDDIEPGLPFDRAIIDQVKKSDMIILLFCAQSDRSKHVKRELMLAEDQDKLIYPVRLEAIEPTGLAYWLQDYQWIDWVDRRDATIERVVQTVKRQVADAEAAAKEAARQFLTPQRDIANAPAEPTPTTEGEAVPVKPMPPTPTPPPKSAAAVPAAASPIATAPMPLVAMSAAGGGNGGNDDGATPSFVRRAYARVGRIGAIAIGAVIALLLLLALLFGLGVFDAAGRGGGGEFVVDPGLWDTRVAVTEIITPMDDARRAETISGLEREGYTESCVSDDLARDPDVGFFDPGGEGNCTLSDFEMADGEYAGRLACEPPALDGGDAEFDFTGSYGADFADTEADVTVRYNDGGELRYTATYRSNRIGECP